MLLAPVCLHESEYIAFKWISLVITFGLLYYFSSVIFYSNSLVTQTTWERLRIVDVLHDAVRHLQ